MKRIATMGLAVALIASAGAVMAFPSLMGPTGGANLPSADTATPGQLNVVVDYSKQDFIVDVTDANPALGIRLVYGVTPNFELGATYCSQNITQDYDDYYGYENLSFDSRSINAKFVTPFTNGGAKWAVGASYLEYTDNYFDSTYKQIYFVGSKTMLIGNETTPTISGSLGVNWTDAYIPNYNGYNDSAIRPFVGVDFTFANNLVLAAEYQMKNDDVLDTKAMTSLSLRYPFADNLVGQLLYTNGVRGVVGSDDHQISLGVNYKFDRMLNGK